MGPGGPLFAAAWVSGGPGTGRRWSSSRTTRCPRASWASAAGEPEGRGWGEGGG